MPIKSNDYSCFSKYKYVSIVLIYCFEGAEKNYDHLLAKCEKVGKYYIKML